ncbi:FKBP-type peptidyl-prolyl cis-trans isomerase [Microbacterium sp. M28]|uniref:FKBP-type peptidyl-prolyl cis-trans isomerase n=1 Tax=Microbacterium sp. M28 TaxID=2962064 RepID=UPI0021F3EE46|nr:FKBP-type peptidyl-prolyl cis-trans isomerase [Microbacterium sp. M28]UYO98299.1 FKBP-type peptidyl-prolyl cis-trans isomerase [Microbacterium sp. M28]
MRTRPIALISTLAAATLLLAGCGSSAPESAETPDASKDLCSVAAESGKASDGVTVDGTFGEVSAATFELGQTVDELQRTVVSEGDGDRIADGDYVEYALSAFDATTGERLGDAGYTDGELLPAQITADASLAQVMGCAPVGTRLSVAFPTSDQAAAQFYIIDVLGVTPTAAWGTEQEPVEGMPTVKLAEDGEPSVEIPDAEAPTELQIAVLKEGDGMPVSAGDTTLLQYQGVNWETGEVFDASWKNGAPIKIDGNTYVEGFIQALEGQKVGSQVLVVIPPALGYGEAGSSEHELAGQTLVFVIDILANQTAAIQQ